MSQQENRDLDITVIPVQRGGGKLESVRILSEKGFPTPKSHYLYEADLSNQKLIAAAFRDLSKPLIVRGSHPNDWHGYIDALPTVRDVSSEENLQQAINTIRETAASDILHRHAHDWGQSFSPQVHVLVQEQSSSPITGSMLRHPHSLDEIHVNYGNSNLRMSNSFLDYRSSLSCACIYDDNHFFKSEYDVSIEEEQLEYAGDIYRSVEKAGLVDPNWVYQMEIGFNPFMIYQLRPFKRREYPQKFNVPDLHNERFPYITSSLVFGITPPEGVQLRFIPEEFLAVYRGFLTPSSNPYGLLLVDRPTDSLPAKIRMGNLAAILSKNTIGHYLEHGDYRLLKKSQFGLLDYHTINIPLRTRLDPKDMQVFSDSYLWSNGKRAVIIPTQYVRTNS